MSYTSTLRDLRSNIRGQGKGTGARRTSAISAIAGVVKDAADGEFARDELSDALQALEVFAQEEGVPFDLELTKLIANIEESDWNDSGCSDSWNDSGC